MKQRLKSKLLQFLAVFSMFTLIMQLSCGTEAPSGATIKMPDDATIETTSDVIFYIWATVTDKNKNPMNDIDVEFLVFNGSFVDYNNATYVKLKTDERGIAFIRVLVPGSYEGDVIVSGSIGVSGDQTKITKKLPQ